MSKSISALEYSIQSKAQKFIDELNSNVALKDMGVDSVSIVETKRELATQMAYFSRGRMDPKYVKLMYAAAGLYTPTDIECCTVNTNTLNSNHLNGRAMDVCPVKDGKLWWDAPKDVWNLIGDIGEKNGFQWGGRWKDLPDCPHFQA